jgi:hypothetical protein
MLDTQKEQKENTWSIRIRSVFTERRTWIFDKQANAFIDGVPALQVGAVASKKNKFGEPIGAYCITNFFFWG